VKLGVGYLQAHDSDGNNLTKTLPNADVITSVYDAANRTTPLTVADFFLVVLSFGGFYLRAVCNYVHLNPVRSGLIDEGKMLNENVSGIRIEATNDDDCFVDHTEIEYRHPPDLVGCIEKTAIRT